MTSSKSWIYTSFVTGAVAAVLAPSGAIAQMPVYMGKASTGEPVYYIGAKAQCGDLPRDHQCWQNPMISYTIGRDQVAAIPNCKQGVFAEIWVDGKLVTRNMKPASKAIQAVLETGCNSVKISP
ncbi:hypothetical protein NIES2135_25130 [Leptolyngbya boryana NIES-2135]|jgi:hypothetical protein|uniref:Uncharacterized protein n=1 Tax=Leptolyngbya boryana NIES-2135 TaxID=1973484 RepID=A0A1Z4JFZ6_LEPBY|nr:MULTISPECIES: hypothetical protein [Leptolyngbya]BAY55689.1 hypothetical protein NIES2135_25130 [Leptolyngbya boryana NIES-2135]MBD2371596.1 hypothetical protein [Leptolyngbya sp. FACHB-161]MBD2378153.1 hypothetical protein [Leptolyngbya sp. FACHB-238]MBD2402557.1 hypothetical protein [Leptolyngbya sp. FACHB-239]MBD2409082.1 hypothetical protein [Leptolyngbya sp. FACHB-402]